MCGLFGQLGSPLTAEATAAVLAALAGRGPDGQGVWREPRADGLTLLHTRLAIQDLSPLGQQPMASADGRLQIVFNGEIYNQHGLRRDLEARGSVFRSGSDTEVLLEGYRHWGDDLWRRLNGIFALAVWDGMTRSLTLARDACGVKPLLWQRRPDGGVAFGSELSTFEAAGLASRDRLCRRGLQSYALWGSVAAPHTLLEGVEVFPAGRWARWHDGHWREGAVRPDADGDRPLAELLSQAVALQSIGDRPVGVFLSGGLDSGLLAALLARQQPGCVRSLAIGFRDLPGAVDEAEAAAATAAHLGLDHTGVRIGPAELHGALDPFLDAIDQPSIDGFNGFLVARAARAAGMVVAFSGLGADELFAGYPHMAWPDEGRRLACRRIPASGLPPWRKASLLADRRRRAGGGGPARLELGGYLQDTLLRDADAVTMAQGLELRVPFLDPHLQAHALACPLADLLADGTKTPLRRLAAELLPAAVLQAPKRGFNLPLAPWLLSDPRFAPGPLALRLAPLGIPAGAVLRSWLLMRATPRRWAPYWRWWLLDAWRRGSARTAAATAAARASGLGRSAAGGPA
jgi:asparagine synthase (glutamine-hydrolysing)